MAVYGGVHAADEEGGYGGHAAGVAPVGGQFLQAGDVGLGHGVVVGQREHQRDVDVDALADEGDDGRDTLRRGRHLDQHVGPAQRGEEPPRLGHRAGGVVSQRGADLQADVAVTTVRAVVHGAQQVGGALDVFQGQRLVDLFH